MAAMEQASGLPATAATVRNVAFPEQIKYEKAVEKSNLEKGVIEDATNSDSSISTNGVTAVKSSDGDSVENSAAETPEVLPNTVIHSEAEQNGAEVSSANIVVLERTETPKTAVGLRQKHTDIASASTSISNTAPENDAPSAKAFFRDRSSETAIGPNHDMPSMSLRDVFWPQFRELVSQPRTVCSDGVAYIPFLILTLAVLRDGFIAVILLITRYVFNTIGFCTLVRCYLGWDWRAKLHGTSTATGTGEDANAGVVGAIRYVNTLYPHIFDGLDPQLGKYELLFMSGWARLFCWFCETFWIVRDVTIRVEGGVLAARTRVMDELMSEALLPRTKVVTDKKQNGLSSGETTACVTQVGSPSSDLHIATADARTAPLMLEKENLMLPPSVREMDSEATPEHCQVIIMGAGFDSRAYRLAAIQKAAPGIKVNVIEVDQHTVQQVKIARLRGGLKEGDFERLTCNVEYVSVNFEHAGALEKALQNAKSFDPFRRTFVLWEGVTYYLPVEAVLATVECLSSFYRKTVSIAESRNCSVPEWQLVFDFTDDAVFTDFERIESLLNWMALAAMNNSVKSTLPLDRERLAAMFEPLGLDIANVWPLAELQGKYWPYFPLRNPLSLCVAHCRWKA